MRSLVCRAMVEWSEAHRQSRFLRARREMLLRRQVAALRRVFNCWMFWMEDQRVDPHQTALNTTATLLKLSPPVSPQYQHSTPFSAPRTIRMAQGVARFEESMLRKRRLKVAALRVVQRRKSGFFKTSFMLYRWHCQQVLHFFSARACEGDAYASGVDR